MSELTRPHPETDAEVRLGDLKDYDINPELEEMESTVAEDNIPHYYLHLRVYFTYHEKADYGGFSVWVPQSWFDKPLASHTSEELHSRIQEYCYEEDPGCLDDYESSFGDGSCVRDVSDDGFTLQAAWWERHATEQELSNGKKAFICECIYVEPDKKPSQQQQDEEDDKAFQECLAEEASRQEILEVLTSTSVTIQEYLDGVWDGNKEGWAAVRDSLDAVRRKYWTDEEQNTDEDEEDDDEEVEFAPEDEVYWTDPDEGKCSGVYVIVEPVPHEQESEYTVFEIRPLAGGSGTQAYKRELKLHAS